jgi:hypothetical protein
VARADEDAAVAGAEGKHVAGGGDVLRALGGVDGDGDGERAVMGGDAGGDALARLDGDGEGVSWRLELVEAMRGRPSWSTRAPVMARQMRPRPWVAMKLIFSGVAIWAGTTRSPSFSRSSWSTRMNMRPLRASSMMSSTGEIASDQSVSGIGWAMVMRGAPVPAGR